MLKRTLLASAAALALLAATAPAQAVSIMYAEWLASLVEPGIAAYEAATGEKVEAIKLPGDGYVERVALDRSDPLYMRRMCDARTVSAMIGSFRAPRT